MKTQKQIEIKTKNFPVFFCKDGIKVGHTFYSHETWRNFTWEYMRQNMGNLQIIMWFKNKDKFRKLYKERLVNA